MLIVACPLPHYVLIVASPLMHHVLIVASLLPHYVLIVASPLPHYVLIVANPLQTMRMFTEANVVLPGSQRESHASRLDNVALHAVRA